MPSPRPAGAWKTVCGDRLTDPNWASINVNRDRCLTAPPDQIATLSNLRVRGATLREIFRPNILTYTAYVTPDINEIEVIPTATSRRYTSLTVNGAEVASGHPNRVALDGANTRITIQVVAPDGTTSRVYTLAVTTGERR